MSDQIGPDRIGVGVIGTGFMGRCHALAWRSVGAVFDDVPLPELVAMCDIISGIAPHCPSSRCPARHR
jgi:predicted dehydrogenase